MNKKNEGFTLIEVLISLALLSMFMLLITSILSLTSQVSKKFLDYSDYEYAMMHKKFFQLYEESETVYLKGNRIILENDKEKTNHRIIITSNKIYKQTQNPGEGYASGYSLLLENIKSYKLNKQDEILVLEIVDREGKVRSMKIYLKDETKKSEKEDKKTEENKADARKNDKDI